jgi:SAM-dependent methyltransferase
MRPGPTLDELAHAGAEHLDAGSVQRYDRKAGTDFSDDVADLRWHGLDDEATVIDMGAGTGGFALAAAPVCARVIAVDVSPAMIAAIRAKVDRDDVRNVECVQAGFLSYEHAGAPVDLIYTRNALHHLPDLWKAMALTRMAALLRPGGVLRLRDLAFAFGPAEAEHRIERWLDTAAASPEDGWTRSELEAHLRSEFSTFTWLLEPMIERAGFRIKRAEHGDLGIYAAYTCVRAEGGARSPGDRVENDVR